MNIAVIGSGFGGLSAACYLAKSGHKVTIFEKNSQLGGRATVLKSKGFLFDMGPSWYTMPDVFENFFKDFGSTPKDFYTLKRLDPNYRIYFAPNDFLDIPKMPEKLKQIFEKLEPGSYSHFQKLLSESKYKYDLSMKKFVYKNYNSLLDFFTPQLLVEGSRLEVFKSMDSYMKSKFKSEKIRKILQYTTVFLGGSPKNTPALYSIMNHIDFNLGVWYPMGGINVLISSLEKLALSLNISIKKNHEIQKILVKDGLATGLVSNGKVHNFDIIVSNADYHHTQTQLLDVEYQDINQKQWSQKTLAPSAFILYLGINKKLKSFKHHTLFFQNNWEEHFDQIFKSPSWPDSPSFYVCCPSQTDSSTAPKNHENLFVLVPIPSGIQDTQKIRDSYSQKIIKYIEDQTSEKFQKNIIFQKTFSIKDYQDLYNSYKGTALGLTHTLFQSAIFRPKNQSKKVKNLYFSGQYTIPGIGMPMCLISGKLAAERINHDFKLQ